jgi:hypothetical protein
MCVPNRIVWAFCLCAAYLLAALPTAAQLVYGQKPTAGLDLVATHWKLGLDDDEVTIDQWAFPVSAFVPLRDNLEARVYLAYAMTTVNQRDVEFELNGLTDLRVQVNHAFANDRLLIGAGLNLPTGHKSLSLDEEWVVMNFLSQNFLSFPVRNLGEGFGLNLMAGGATEMGDYRVGATATANVSGAYNAYETEPDYNPGNSLSLTLGLQREIQVGVLNGDATFTTSADDKQADKPIFGRGDQLALHGGLATGGKQQRYFADATYRIRGRNKLYNADSVLLQQLKIYGNEFVVAGGLERSTASDWTYGPAVDLRLIAGNETGLGSSKVLGIGAHLARAVTTSVNLRLALKYFTGSTNDSEIDLAGYQAWLSASGTF